MNATNIEWADVTWNPITGCSHAGSPGCDHCYAARMANRLRGMHGYDQEKPFRPTFHPDKLQSPSRYTRPMRVFVGSMTDMFHPGHESWWLDAVWSTIRSESQHTYMMLTKRPDRIHETLYLCGMDEFPDNCWIGATVCTQDEAIRCIDHLARVHAPVKFVSCEPLLEDLTLELDPGCPQVDWVIVGGETGPGARDMHCNWARRLRDESAAVGVPFFFKQRARKALPIPDDLMVREFPQV